MITGTPTTKTTQPKKDCNVNFAATPALLGAIDRIATREEVSRSVVIRRALLDFIKRSEAVPANRG